MLPPGYLPRDTIAPAEGCPTSAASTPHAAAVQLSVPAPAFEVPRPSDIAPAPTSWRREHHTPGPSAVHIADALHFGQFQRARHYARTHQPVTRAGMAAA